MAGTAFAIIDRKSLRIKVDRDNMFCIFNKLEEAEDYFNAVVIADKRGAEIQEVDFNLTATKPK